LETAHNGLNAAKLNFKFFKKVFQAELALDFDGILIFRRCIFNLYMDKKKLCTGGLIICSFAICGFDSFLYPKICYLRVFPPLS
jgi:hypothetical protein